MRRTFLIGGAAALLVPARVLAQPGGEREHRPQLDLPILSEEPTAVPLQVWVDHPMEPDHFIRALEVMLETDPVPHKGKFLFTPANGRAWVSFQMRSGSGGIVKAVAECSKHGRFVATKELRVAEGGCTTPPDKAAKEKVGNPVLRLPRAPKPGEIIEVRAKIDHNSYTGLGMKGGKIVRETPEFYVTQMLVTLDGEKISEFQMTSAVSPNPLIRFPLKVTRGGVLRVVFANNEGRQWEVSQPIQV